VATPNFVFFFLNFIFLVRRSVTILVMTDDNTI